MLASPLKVSSSLCNTYWIPNKKTSIQLCKHCTWLFSESPACRWRTQQKSSFPCFVKPSFHFRRKHKHKQQMLLSALVIIYLFIYLLHSTGQDFTAAQRERAQEDFKVLFKGAPHPPSHSHTKDSHSTGITLLLLEQKNKKNKPLRLRRSVVFMLAQPLKTRLKMLESFANFKMHVVDNY